MYFIISNFSGLIEVNLRPLERLKCHIQDIQSSLRSATMIIAEVTCRTISILTINA